MSWLKENHIAERKEPGWLDKYLGIQNSEFNGEGRLKDRILGHEKIS